MLNRFLLWLSRSFLQCLFFQFKSHHLNISFTQTSLLINLKRIRVILLFYQPKNYLLILQSYKLQKLISQALRQFIYNLSCSYNFISLLHFFNFALFNRYLLSLYYTQSFLFTFHLHFTFHLVVADHSLSLLLLDKPFSIELLYLLKLKCQVLQSLTLIILYSQDLLFVHIYFLHITYLSKRVPQSLAVLKHRAYIRFTIV